MVQVRLKKSFLFTKTFLQFEIKESDQKKCIIQCQYQKENGVLKSTQCKFRSNMDHVILDSTENHRKKRSSIMLSFQTRKSHEVFCNFGHKCFIRTIVLMSCIISDDAFSFNEAHSLPTLYGKSFLSSGFSNISSLKSLMSDSNDEVFSLNTKMTANANANANAKSKPNEKLPKHIPNNPRTLIDYPYASTIKALRSYHLIHGDLVMPRRYIVSEDFTGRPYLYKKKLRIRFYLTNPRDLTETLRLPAFRHLSLS